MSLPSLVANLAAVPSTNAQRNLDAGGIGTGATGGAATGTAIGGPAGATIGAIAGAIYGAIGGHAFQGKTKHYAYSEVLQPSGDFSTKAWNNLLSSGYTADQLNSPQLIQAVVRNFLSAMLGTWGLDNAGTNRSQYADLQNWSAKYASFNGAAGTQMQALLGQFMYWILLNVDTQEGQDEFGKFVTALWNDIYGNAFQEVGLNAPAPPRTTGGTNTTTGGTNTTTGGTSTATQKASLFTGSNIAIVVVVIIAILYFLGKGGKF